jgi:hypothetical protein
VAEPTFATATPEGLLLRLKVVPGASRDQLAGVLGDRLKVRVAAAPEAGKANAAVLALLNRWLKRKDVRLVAGPASAEKTVLVPGATTLSPDLLAEL